MPYKDPDKRREVNRKSQKKYYENNKEKVKATNRKRNQRVRSELRSWYREIKKQFKCAVCGENHPACIEFHHRNGKDKDFNIGEAISNQYSKEKIMEEILKCIPLCANCHRKLHNSDDENNYDN